MVIKTGQCPVFFWLLVTLYARVAGTRCVLCVFSVFIASKTKQSRFIMSAGDARSAFYLLDCHATDVARNDKRRLPGAPPLQ